MDGCNTMNGVGERGTEMDDTEGMPNYVEG